MLSTAWTAGLLLVSIYCLVQAVRDFRRGDYVIAAAGAACALLLLLVPIKSHAVKVDLIAPSSP